MTLFDWMPGWRWHDLPIDWIALIAFCFGLAALFVFDPCQTTIFASLAGNSC